MRCDQIADSLSEVADGSWILPGPERAHVEQCLRCQAQLVQYRKLLRALRTMRTEILEPAPGMVAEILAAMEVAGEKQVIRSILSGRKAAYVGGIAAATAAGAAGVIVIAQRSKRNRLSLAS